MSSTPGIDLDAAPSGDGCVECTAGDGWWFHLRRCAQCGHIGCCDSSPGQHATAHWRESGHPIVQSFEPDEDWFWSYADEATVHGPVLPDPQNRPREWSAPGPAERLPADWRDRLV